MNFLQKRFLSCTLLVVLTAATFTPCLWNKITNWDDQFMLTKNEMVKDLSWDGITRIFTSFTNGSYVPFTVLSYAFEYSFSEFNPHVYHATNIILHLLNVLLVFWLLNLITKQPFTALIVALLFAINPLKVESVAWVSARKDLLSSFYFLCAMISYIYHIINHRKLKLLHFLTFVLFILSVLAKPQALVLPVILLSLDAFYDPKTWKVHLLSKLPFAVISIVSIVIGRFSLTPYLAEQVFYNAFNPIEKFFLTAHSIFFYIKQTLIPIQICALYPYPPKEVGYFPWFVYLSAPFLFVLIGYLIKRFKDDKKLLWAVFFFMATLALPLSNIWLGGYFAADRYMYLPSIGLFLALTHVACEYRHKALEKYKEWRPVLLVIYVLFMITLSVSKCFVWKNDITLWSDVLDLYKNTPIAYNNRGSAYLQVWEFDKAMDDLNQAIRLNSKYKDAYFNRALFYTDTGQYDQAIADYSTIIALDSKHVEAYNNRGYIFLKQNKLSEAVNDFSQSLRINPDYTQARLNRAHCYAQLKDFPRAVADLNAILKSKPDHPDARQLLDNLKNLQNL